MPISLARIGARDIHEVAMAVDHGVPDDRVVAISVQVVHLRRNARRERVRHDVAARVDHENVRDAADFALLQVLVDHGLNGRGVAIQQAFDGRPGDAIGDGFAFAFELLGEIALDDPGREHGRGCGGKPEDKDQHQERLGE